ncbi:MAG: sel1 repeat family protein, partial [Planctomycetes bacterium]|nr:sel1 repeat family protein [Planctomycetota bacterium]
GARDAGQAVAWLRRAADAGRADAQALLAEHLAAGLGVARDLTEALRLFAAAANAGEPAAMTGLARLLLAGPEATWAEGARWAHKAAGAGHTPGMVLLAGTLTKGRGVRRSTRNAISYLRRAAERGDGDAVLRLAHLFDDLGRSQAARELSKALADKGDARAMLLLTRLHVSRRAPSTAAEAVRWANLLVERGDPEALLFVARRGAEADAQVTLALLRRAAEAGLPGAMVDLARRLEASEPAAARGWLERAAALGETEARLLLAAGR